MRTIIYDIIDDALWSPTPDNIQNWQFTILHPNSLMVSIDEEKWDHPLDPHQHASILSLGGFCEYVIIAAAHRGLQTTWKIQSDGKSISFSFLESSINLSPQNKYYRYLRERRTDRRVYRKDAPGPKLIERLESTNNDFDSTVFVATKGGENLYDYLEQCERCIWKIDGVARETFKLVEPTSQIPPIGFNYKNAGLNKLEIFLFSWLLKSERRTRWALKWGMANMIARKMANVYRRSAGQLLFTVKNNSMRDLFEVGRHAIRCWLILSDEKMMAQPLTFSALSCFDMRCLQEKKFTEIEKNLDLFYQGEATLRGTFNHPAEEIPCWLFRFGMPISYKKAIPIDRLKADNFAIKEVNQPGALISEVIKMKVGSGP